MHRQPIALASLAHVRMALYTILQMVIIETVQIDILTK
jgi:hypothetical protein